MISAATLFVLLLVAFGAGVPQRSPLADVDLSTVVITMKRENRCSFRFSEPTSLDQCADYEVTLRGDGSVTYVGHHGVKTVGTSSYRISARDARALLAEFDRAEFFGLEDEYDAVLCHGVRNVRDHVPLTTTTIAAGGRTRRVVHAYGAPDALLRLEAQIDELSGARRLTGREPTPTISRASIAGTIKTERGQPLAGVQVRISMTSRATASEPWSTTVTSDRDGNYRIEGLCPVSFQIDVQLDGHSFATAQFVLLYYGQRSVHDFVMRRAGRERAVRASRDH